MSSKRKGVDVFDPCSGTEPIEVPLEFREPPSLVDEIRRFVRIEVSRRADEAGFETFEEANDLEFSDDDDLESVHELTEDQEMAMMSARARARVEEENERVERSRKQAGAVGSERKADDLAGAADLRAASQAPGGAGGGFGGERDLRDKGEGGGESRKEV